MKVDLSIFFFGRYLVPKGKIITEGTFDWFPPRNDPPEASKKQFLLSMIFCLLVFLAVFSTVGMNLRDFYLPCKLVDEQRRTKKITFAKLHKKWVRDRWTLYKMCKVKTVVRDRAILFCNIAVYWEVWVTLLVTLQQRAFMGKDI